MGTLRQGLGGGHCRMSKYTRQAIALAYGRHPVPIITAKGDDDLARRMIEEAEKHGVEIFAAPPLARALYFTTKLDHPIP